MMQKLLNNIHVIVILSVLVVLSFPLIALGVKFQLWHFRAAFAMLGGVAVTGAILFLLNGLAFLGAQKLNLGRAKAASLLSIMVLIIPLGFLGLNAVKAKQVPFIHDISTDGVNPPMFRHAGTIRGEVENSLEYDPATYTLQASGYPDIKSSTFKGGVEQWSALTVEGIKAQGWSVTFNDGHGHIEATDQSFWFGFVDDIVIRLTATDGAVVFDMRSVSRVGKSDLGKNAERIRQLQGWLLDQQT